MKYVGNTCLLLTLIGISLSVKALPLGPLDGILVTSYTATGTIASPLSPASLTLNHTDNLGFDGTIMVGSSTGDVIEGTDWALNVIATDYQALVPDIYALLGMQIETTSGDFQLGETQTFSFGLTFSKGQYFQNVNPSFGNLAFTTPTTATLTPFGGSTENLLNTATNTLFPAGDYVLNMEGVITTVTSSAGLVAHFAAIPEPSVLAFVLIGMVLFTKAFRAGKR